MEEVASAWKQCLCLREIQHWYDVYQPLVNDGRWDDPKWQSIVSTPTHLSSFVAFPVSDLPAPSLTYWTFCWFNDAHLIVAIRKSLLCAANSVGKETTALGNVLSRTRTLPSTD